MYETGTYVKGNLTRRANTARDAVQAVFDGYKLEGQDGVQAPDPEVAQPDEAPHTELPSDGDEPSVEASAAAVHSNPFI